MIELRLLLHPSPLFGDDFMLRTGLVFRQQTKNPERPAGMCVDRPAILQYRDAPTHDSPWIDVPTIDRGN